jgi:acyl carrier protein
MMPSVPVRAPDSMTAASCIRTASGGPQIDNVGHRQSRSLQPAIMTRNLPSIDNPADVEAYLTDLWKQCLGVTEVGLDDDFFELGGASMTGIAMLLAVSKFYDCEFDFEKFFGEPRIRNLCALIRSGLSARMGT